MSDCGECRGCPASSWHRERCYERNKEEDDRQMILAHERRQDWQNRYIGGGGMKSEKEMRRDCTMPKHETKEGAVIPCDLFANCVECKNDES